MKQLLITIAAVVLVGCGESQQSTPEPESNPVEPITEAANPEPPKAKAPDISIQRAADEGNLEAVKQHLAAGTDVNAKNRSGVTPLHIAVFGGHKEVAELLIANGANVDAKDKGGNTPLGYAIGRGRTETADLLRKHGGKTGEELSIYIAAMSGNIEAVKQHLNDGAEVNAKNSDGRTPLHLAAFGGHKEIVELLIAKGADVNVKFEDGKTALNWVSSRGEIANLLRKHGGKTKKELEAEGK